MSDQKSILTRVAQGVLGAVGFYAAIRFLPRLLRSMTRRFFLGLIGEILILAFSLFMTQRATDATSNGRARQPSSPPADASTNGTS